MTNDAPFWYRRAAAIGPPFVAVRAALRNQPLRAARCFLKVWYHCDMRGRPDQTAEFRREIKRRLVLAAMMLAAIVIGLLIRRLGMLG
jgi:hypothetical protein